MLARGNIRCLNVSRNARFLSVIRVCSLATACILPLLTRAEPPFQHASASVSAPSSRVVVVENPSATEAFRAQPETVLALVRAGIIKFSGKTNAVDAWRSVVSTQDVVGIKVFSGPGPLVGTRPDVAAGVIEGLLAAGLGTNRIIVWDRQLAELRRAGFGELAQRYQVRLAGALESGWDETVFYESALLGQPLFGDLEFGKKGDTVGRRSYVSKLVTKEITKIISISPMLNHNSVGVCGNLYSLALGSVDNTLRFEGDTARLSEAVPELYALPALGDRVALNIVDALVCQYEGEQIGRLHSSAALNQLRFSKDPVALDVLSIGEIMAQRERSELVQGSHTNKMVLYRNAALLELGVADPKRIDLHVEKVLGR
jgi:hypothetical protein